MVLHDIYLVLGGFRVYLISVKDKEILIGQLLMCAVLLHATAWLLLGKHC